jgi:hypothetical protein
MCGVTSMESLIVKYIKAIILADLALKPLMEKPLNINTYCLTS